MKDAPNLPKNTSEPTSIIVSDGVYKIHWHIPSIPVRYPVVDMALAGDSNGVHNVKLFHDNNEPESTWRFFRYSNSPLYQISNGINNLLLLGRSKGNDNNAIASPKEAGSDRWTWLLRDAGDGLVYIENYSNHYVLDVAGSNPSDNTDIILYPNQGSINQKFRLAKLRDL